MGLDWLAEAMVGVSWWGWLGLAPRGSQGAPVTDPAVSPCFAGQWEGDYSHPSLHTPFREFCALYLVMWL